MSFMATGQGTHHTCCSSFTSRWYRSPLVAHLLSSPLVPPSTASSTRFWASRLGLGTHFIKSRVACSISHLGYLYLYCNALLIKW